MSTNTTIEWADKTWSPIIGCDRVSPGCDRCYAISVARIRESNPHPGIAAAFAGTTTRTDNGIDWSGKINLLEDRLTEPLRWRKPRKIFVNSLSDLFHKNVPDEYIAQMLAVMALTPQHIYQVLTKRHGRMRSFFNAVPEPGVGWLPGSKAKWLVHDALEAFPRDNPDIKLTDEQWALCERSVDRLVWPLPNLWLGVSVEDQKHADLRIPALLETPAAVRFLSCEPLFGPVDIAGALRDDVYRCRCGAWERDGNIHKLCAECGAAWAQEPGSRIGWVIAGGESGPSARPMSPEWARSLRDQCQDADVPYLFKQWGAYQPTGYMAIGARTTGCVFVGDPIDDLGHRWEMRRVGKKAAGRELDGRTHDAFPETGGA